MGKNERQLEVISPIGGKSIPRKTIAPPLKTLEGKTICETWNLEFKGDYMFPLYRELLKKRYPGVKVIPYNEFPSSAIGGSPEYQRKVAREIVHLAKQKGCDVLISGNGG